MKVVKVLWVDSCNSNMNWTVTEDIEIELMYIDSFGVVVKDTDEFLAIAQNYGDNPEQYSNITTIPKGCIKEVFVIHEDNVYENEQKPTDKVEPKFKVKYAGSEYNVLEVKDIAGVTYYGIEDEPNHIDYVLPDNCERVGGYSIKENGSPYPTKPAVFSEQNSAWSEDDENVLEDIEEAIINYWHGDTQDILLDWLKSLKERYTWKPSDEQIVALRWVLNNIPYNKHKEEISGLLDQIKEL